MPDTLPLTVTADDVVTGNTSHTRPENRLYFPALDGLRALAVTLVFAQHYLHLPWGWTGVDLFFVLSGFLITGILFDTRDAVHRVRSFYVRRALRIFPLYYGLLLALLITTPIFHWQWNAYWLIWPVYLGNVIRFVHPYSQSPAFLQAANGVVTGIGTHHYAINIGHFWSLSLEEQFYLAWPWVVFSVRNRRRLIWICGTAILITPVLRVLAMAWLPHRFSELELTYSATPFRIDALLLGGLIALLLRGATRQLVHSIARSFFLLVGTMVLVLWLLSLRHHPYHYPAWRLTWGFTLVDLVAASLIVLCLAPASIPHRLFKLRPLRWLGRISYGAYVFHDIPHTLYSWLVARAGYHSAFVALHETALTALLAFVATLILAWLSFRYFESPFLDLKERLAPS